MTRPAVLCPVDFRPGSRTALRYAAALAEHFYATLIVLHVNDAAAGDVAAFADEALDGRRPTIAELRFETANGLPGVEILRVAHEHGVDAIVMSTRGAEAPMTLLGSVTEHVLRHTRVPVIVTPPHDPGPRSLEALRPTIHTVLVPVDLSAWTPRQVAVACGLALAIGARLLFLHVLADDDHARRLAAHQALDRLIHDAPCELQPHMCLAIGDPATEIARVARDRRAGVIVMGLHATPDKTRGMGHITHAVLCQAPVVTLAWPGAEEGTEKEELRTEN